LKVVYPKDTPVWLRDVIENADDAVRNQLMDGVPTTENLLIARGASKLIQRIMEEIDAIGRVEGQMAQEAAKEAVKRG
jgi:hypothetical protein